SAGVAVCSLVKSLNQITRLLKFGRKKVSGRDIDAFQLKACLVCAARSNLVGPKGQAALVGLSIKKIMIVLTNEYRRVINWIRSRVGSIIVDYIECRCWRGSQRCGRRNTGDVHVREAGSLGVDG